MEIALATLAAHLTAALLALSALAPGSDLFEVDVRRLAEVWQREHNSPDDPYVLDHAELRRRLGAIAREFPDLIRLEPAGRSVQGREIALVSLGSGSQRILLWSQMHGDEPTATSALLDLFRFLGAHRREPWVARILAAYTLDAIPMLNPDGAERRQRRNAQGIDINRDARALQTPEGRLLKSVRDARRPFLGFNLHNQNGQTTVGDSGRVATIALLAVAADAPRAAPEADPQIAKKVTAVLFEALSPFVYGHISRYDEDYNPRAFGDNLTLWGTPIVLVESGGIPAGQPRNLTVMLNFVGLLAVLDSLSSGRIGGANPAVFDAMKRNSDAPIFDLLLRDAWIANGKGAPLFRGDVAVRRDNRGQAAGGSIIADVGDLSVSSAHETIDCAGKLLTPGLIGWARDLRFPAGGARDREFLQRGFVSIVETAVPADASEGPVERGRSEKRSVHRSFVLLGGPGRADAAALLGAAGWLAAGARAWILDAPPDEVRRVARWFDVELMTSAAARAFEIPARLEGETVEAVRHWTSEAAARFRLARRGAIEVGAAPDLVLWEAPPGAAPSNLRECRPVRLVIDGQLLDPSSADLPAGGRLLR